MRLANCRVLTQHPLTGTWYRAIRPQFFHTALAFQHTKTIPGRFHAASEPGPVFPVLYLAESPLTALFEVNALLGSPLPGQASVPNPQQPWTLLNVEVRLQRIVDLTQSSQRRLIDTTVQELTGDWRGYTLRSSSKSAKAPYWTNVPTQRLGTALHRVRGVEGFLTYSAKSPTQRNLIVLPDKLRRGSYLRFTDPTTGMLQSIP